MMKRPATSKGAEVHGIQVSRVFGVCCQKNVTTGLRCWERPSEARWHTGKGGIGFIGGAEEIVRALTFSLDTLTSNYN